MSLLIKELNRLPPLTESRTSVLVIAGLGRWVDGVAKVGKIETHVQPIALAADGVDFVCTGPTADSTEGITYHQIEPSRWKLLTLLRQLLVGLRLAIRNDYDVIVSFSLVPYGIFALVSGVVSRTPTHLGIIGSDLDVHAKGRYAPIVQWLFRRFNVVTVAGEEFRGRLADCGVDRSRIHTVLHPVRSDYASVSPEEDPSYDLLWLTRVSSVKSPLLFVDIIAELVNRGNDVTAAIVGSGPLLEEVRDAIERRDLKDRVDVPGWSESPEEFYRDARIYVLTSNREMLPLTVVEAMLVGTPPVVPPLGGIPDIVEDGENGVLVESREIDDYVDAIEWLLAHEQLRHELAAEAPEIEAELSYDAVADTWERIFSALEARTG